MGCLLDELRAPGINADQWTTAAQDEGQWRKTTEQGAERFMAKWIASEKVRAGLRHAVVCPNVRGRTKNRIAQSTRVPADSLAIVDCPQVVFFFLWRYVYFVLFRFRIFAFTEVTALRSTVLRSSTCMRPDSHTQLPNSWLPLSPFSFLWRCRFFFRVFFKPLPFHLCLWKVCRTFHPSGYDACFTFVTTSWIFDISLCKNSTNHIKNGTVPRFPHR